MLSIFDDESYYLIAPRRARQETYYDGSEMLHRADSLVEPESSHLN